MKTNYLIALCLSLSFGAKCQFTDVDFFKLPQNSPVVYANEKQLYTIDHQAFYAYKIASGRPYWFYSYTVDTIKWNPAYRSLPNWIPLEDVCKFKDDKNGVIIKAKEGDSTQAVVLKTTNGGYNWDLLLNVPDSLGKFLRNIAFHDFNHFLIQCSKGVYIYREDAFYKVPTDTFHQLIHTEEGVFVAASVYNKQVHVSTDMGKTWQSYTIPAEGEYNFRSAEKIYVRNNKVIVHHRPSPYTPLEESHTIYITTIDSKTKSLTQKKIGGWADHVFVDKIGNEFFTTRQYLPTYGKVRFKVYLTNNSSTPILLEDRLKGYSWYKSYQTPHNEVLVWDDSTVTVFDHVDCPKFQVEELSISSKSTSLKLETSTEIHALNYPQFTVLDFSSGDTVGRLCCWYQLDDSFSMEYEGNTVKKPKSDSLVVVLKGQEGACVIPHLLKSDIPTPLGIFKEQSALQLFPNPSRSTIQIETKGRQASVRMVNSSGTEVMGVKAYQSEQLKVEHLEPGLYKVILNFEDGSSQVSTFVKE